MSCGNSSNRLALRFDQCEIEQENVRGVESADVFLFATLEELMSSCCQKEEEIHSRSKFPA